MVSIRVPPSAILVDIVLACFVLLVVGFITSKDFKPLRKLLLVLLILSEISFAGFYYGLDQGKVYTVLTARFPGNFMPFLFTLGTYQLNVLGVQGKFMSLFLLWRSAEYFKAFKKRGGFAHGDKSYFALVVAGVVYVGGVVDSIVRKNPQSFFDFAVWICLCFFNYKLSEYEIEPFSNNCFKYLLAFCVADLLGIGFLLLLNKTVMSPGSSSGINYVGALGLVLSVVLGKYFICGCTGFSPARVLYSLRMKLMKKKDPYIYNMRALEEQQVSPAKEDIQDGGAVIMMQVEAEPIEEKPIAMLPKGMPLGAVPLEAPMNANAFAPIGSPVNVQRMPVMPNPANNYVPVLMSQAGRGKPIPVANDVQFPDADVNSKIPVAYQGIPAASPHVEIPEAAVSPHGNFNVGVPAAAMYNANGEGEGGERGLPNPVDVQIVGRYNAPQIAPVVRERPVSVVSANDNPSAALADALRNAKAQKAAKKGPAAF